MLLLFFSVLGLAMRLVHLVLHVCVRRLHQLSRTIKLTQLVCRLSLPKNLENLSDKPDALDASGTLIDKIDLRLRRLRQSQCTVRGSESAKATCGFCGLS
jgi:hypothetical protein